MNLTAGRLTTIAVLWAAPFALHAQFDFKVAGRDVQVHSFASQGYLYGDVNHFLTVRNGGSFAMTDGGLNITTKITDNFRVGAQLYDRSIGKLGKGTVTLDWAFGDYKFRDWIGVRAGKVKTALGLYNDTQDMPFLHTWAMMPQSMYPIDLRGNTIAHVGGDVYGNIAAKRLGSFAYTAYVGQRPSDPTGGYAFGLLASGGVHIVSMGGLVAGADLRWNTPLKGLTAGASFMDQDITLNGVKVTPAAAATPHFTTKKNETYAYYVTYSLGNLQLDGEYRRNWKVVVADPGKVPGGNPADARSWYTSAAYRFCKWFELGTYHSRFYNDWGTLHSANTNHIFDQSFTARFDLTKFWNVKIERHFLDGYGVSGSFQGFYAAQNRAGFQPKTNVWMVRTGFNF